MAARLALVAGLAIAAAIGSTYLKKEIVYSKDEYFKQLALGFTSNGFTMKAVQQQWETDRNRTKVLYYEKYAKKWVQVKYLPLNAPKYLYKILLASACQVGPAFALEKVMEENPQYIILHPSSDAFPFRLWVKDNSMKYEMYFKAVNDKLIEQKIIKVNLIIEWDCKDITKIAVSQQKVLYPDS